MSWHCLAIDFANDLAYVRNGCHFAMSPIHFGVKRHASACQNANGMTCRADHWFRMANGVALRTAFDVKLRGDDHILCRKKFNVKESSPNKVSEHSFMYYNIFMNINIIPLNL